jgi:hypothetical protein
MVAASFPGGSRRLILGFQLQMTAGGLGRVVSFVAVILIIGFAVVAVGWAIGRDA